MLDELPKLEAAHAAALTDLDRIQPLNALAEYWASRAPTRAIAYADEALTIAERAADAPNAAIARLRLAEAHFYDSNFPECLTHALAASDAAAACGLKRQQITAISLMGNAYHGMGNLPEAQRCYLELVRLGDEVGDQSIVSGGLINMGILFSEMGNHTEGESYLVRGIALAEAAGMSALGLAERRHNLSVAYFRSARFAEALALTQANAQIFSQHQEALRLALAESTGGSCHQELGDGAAARAAFERAMTAALATGSANLQAYIERQQAGLALKEGRYAEALPKFEHALKVMLETDDLLEASDTHQQLAAAYRSIGDFQQALAHYEAYHALYRQVFDQQSDLRLKSLQITHQVEQARLESAALKQELAARAEAEQQRIAMGVERERLAALQLLFTHTYHDLMTPISTIKLSLYLLGRTADATVAAAKRATIEAQVDLLSRVIQRMLLMAKLDGSAEPLRPTPILSTDLIDCALRLLPPNRVDQRRVQWAADEGIMLAVDPELLPIALAEVLDNALRFSPPDTPVSISAAREGNRFCWRIADHGPGIPPDKLAQIFTLLYRAETHRPSDSGAGLGLPIARLIIVRHGGCLEVESTVGVGSTFIIELPLSAPDAD